MTRAALNNILYTAPGNEDTDTQVDRISRAHIKICSDKRSLPEHRKVWSVCHRKAPGAEERTRASRRTIHAKPYRCSNIEAGSSAIAAPQYVDPRSATRLPGVELTLVRIGLTGDARACQHTLHPSGGPSRCVQRTPSSRWPMRDNENQSSTRERQGNA